MRKREVALPVSLAHRKRLKSYIDGSKIVRRSRNHYCRHLVQNNRTFTACLLKRALRQLINDFMGTNEVSSCSILPDRVQREVQYSEASVERRCIQFCWCSWSFMPDSRCDRMACSSVYLALLLGFVYAIVV